MYIEKKNNSWLLSTEVKECSSFAKNVCHMLSAICLHQWGATDLAVLKHPERRYIGGIRASYGMR